MKAHILLLVSSFATPQDPRRGAKYKQHLEYYKAAGWNVGLISLRQRDFGFLEHLSTGQIYPEVQSSGAPVLLNPAYDSTLRRLGIMSRSKAMARTASGVAAKYIRKYGRPDIIHANGIDNVAVHLEGIAPFDGIPVIVTENNSKYLSANPELGTERRAAVVARASRIVAVSSALETALGKVLPLREGQSCTIHNMVHPIFFDTPLKARDPDRPFTFFTLSLLTRKKRIDLAIDAFHRSMAGTDARLRIAGFGPEVPELERQITELGLEEQIELLGPLPKERVAEEMASADCYLCPSDVETFGIPLVEAAAAGTPLIATRCGGPADIVTPCNGLLSDRGDVAQFAAAMSHIRANQQDYDPAEIRSDCFERFSHQAVLPRIGALYEEVLAD